MILDMTLPSFPRTISRRSLLPLKKLKYPFYLIIIIQKEREPYKIVK